MVGDVNMFLPDGVDEEGECEIMIAGAPYSTSFYVANGAEKEDRRKGFAREALTLL
jgi:hypothetical protein